MKKRSIYLILCVLFSISATAQNEDNPILNGNGLTYDSVMHTLNRKDLSFDDKYNIVAYDIHNTYPYDKTSEIYLKVKHLAEEEGRYNEVYTMYTLVANNYALQRDPDNIKLYLDSALLYEDKVEDLYSLGIYYYLRATYYQILEDMENSHVNNYKAIEYLEKNGGADGLIMMIYYNMIAHYVIAGDLDAINKIRTKTRVLDNDESRFETRLYINQFSSIYFNELYEKNKNAQDADSGKYYSNKSIALYESLTDQQQDIAHNHILYDYYTVIDYQLENEKPNWAEVEDYTQKVEIRTSPTDTSRIVWIHKSKGSIALNKKQYKNAESEFLTSLNLLNAQTVGKSTREYIDIYQKLTDTYTSMGDFKKALQYKNLKEGIASKYQEETRLKAMKELDVKYETAKKELEISQLSKKQQEILLNRTIVVSILLLVSAVLLSAFLYNRMKRLKKEREALALTQRLEEKEGEYLKLQNEIERNKTEGFIKGLESERARLAKELHDGVSNDLVAVKMMLNADKDKAEIIELLADVHNSVRNSSHALMSPLFREATFADVMTDYVLKQQQKAGTNIELNLYPLDGWDRIDNNTSLELYRIVQESVSNAIKHANAKLISVDAMLEGDQLTLIVLDDGKGFDVNQKHQGIGLKVLKDRAGYIGGKLDISSSGKGTMVKLVAPIYIHQEETADEEADVLVG